MAKQCETILWGLGEGFVFSYSEDWTVAKLKKEAMKKFGVAVSKMDNSYELVMCYKYDTDDGARGCETSVKKIPKGDNKKKVATILKCTKLENFRVKNVNAVLTDTPAGTSSSSQSPETEKDEPTTGRGSLIQKVKQAGEDTEGFRVTLEYGMPHICAKYGIYQIADTNDEFVDWLRENNAVILSLDDMPPDDAPSSESEGDEAPDSFLDFITANFGKDTLTIDGTYLDDPIDFMKPQDILPLTLNVKEPRGDRSF